MNRLMKFLRSFLPETPAAPPEPAFTDYVEKRKARDAQKRADPKYQKEQIAIAVSRFECSEEERRILLELYISFIGAGQIELAWKRAREKRAELQKANSSHE